MHLILSSGGSISNCALNVIPARPYGVQMSKLILKTFGVEMMPPCSMLTKLLSCPMAQGLALVEILRDCTEAMKMSSTPCILRAYDAGAASEQKGISGFSNLQDGSKLARIYSHASTSAPICCLHTPPVEALGSLGQSW